MADFRLAVGVVAARVLISGCRPASVNEVSEIAPASPTPEADGVHFTFSAKGNGDSDSNPGNGSQSPALVSASADITNDAARFSLNSSDGSASGPNVINAALNIVSHGSNTNAGSESNSGGATTMNFTANGKVITISGSGSDITRTLKDAIASDSVHLVKVRSDYGSIKFAPSSDASQIGVEADVSFSGSQVGEARRSELLNGFTLTLEKRGGALQISVKKPTDFPEGVGFGVAYRIAIPQGLSIDARTSNGAVEVEKTGRGGDITAESDYGAITIVNSGENVDARTSSGAITVKSYGNLDRVAAHSDYGAVSVSGLAKTVDASSSNGSVSVTGAVNADKVAARSDYGAVRVTDCSGAVDETSSNGEVDYSAEAAKPKSLDCKSDYGTLNISLGDCSVLSRAQLGTSNGSVNLTASPSARLRFHAHTENGSISKDGLSGDVTGEGAEKTFDGTLNGGHAAVEIHSDYGSVTISAR